MTETPPAARRSDGRIAAAALLSLSFLVLLRVPPFRDPAGRKDMLEAAALMARAEAAIRSCREAQGPAIDPVTDPNRTGLIGVERSIVTTSLGSLEAKRTTANPAFAALVVTLFREAGVGRGDIVAVGASSSFPALVVATLAAARAAGVEPLVISSLGASEWGANIPGFGWLEMEDCLRQAGLLEFVPIARSIGGEGDRGEDMDPAGRALIESRVRAGVVPSVDEPSLEWNVAARLAAYRRAAGARPIKAFVNIGGSWANMGADAEVLKVEPGLARDVFVPPPGRRGVLQAMAAAGVPVIHLLNVKGLCERYGLPWDPRPLPAPGQGPLFRLAAAKSRPATALIALYVLAMAVLLAIPRRPL
ncbi:MAG TPA: poly-gamma-glutamate system protein [Acidobacteriota bacterium]|nr:poly-gamma-glutamate system protein [Acidobacteriota bacterium]